MLCRLPDCWYSFTLLPVYLSIAVMDVSLAGCKGSIPSMFMPMNVVGFQNLLDFSGDWSCHFDGIGSRDKLACMCKSSLNIQTRSGIIPGKRQTLQLFSGHGESAQHFPVTLTGHDELPLCNSWIADWTIHIGLHANSMRSYSISISIMITKRNSPR